jgi:hypothetical protein
MSLEKLFRDSNQSLGKGEANKNNVIFMTYFFKIFFKNDFLKFSSNYFFKVFFILKCIGIILVLFLKIIFDINILKQ